MSGGNGPGDGPGAGRIERRFAELKSAGRGGLVTFLTAGDPDPETAREIVLGLPAAGADLIELGMPFSDPMADGPSIQASSLRALKTGASLPRTLDLVRAFRATDDATPIILMGYYNPIYAQGRPSQGSAACLPRHQMRRIGARQPCTRFFPPAGLTKSQSRLPIPNSDQDEGTPGSL